MQNQITMTLTGNDLGEFFAEVSRVYNQLKGVFAVAAASESIGEKPSLNVNEGGARIRAAVETERQTIAAEEKVAEQKAEKDEKKKGPGRPKKGDKPADPPKDRLFDDETAAVDAAPLALPGDGAPEYLGRMADPEMFQFVRQRAKAFYESMLPDGVVMEQATPEQRQTPSQTLAAVWADEIGVTGVAKIEGSRELMLKALSVFDNRLGIDPATGEVAEADAADDLL